MDGFATMERYGNERYVDWRCNADTRSNLDFPFDTRLDTAREGLMNGTLLPAIPPGTIKLTIVAEIPG